MKDMIYYPGFEVQDQSWLKFALLYFDHIRPIFPNTYISERKFLSDSFREVMAETDLILPYRPDYEEEQVASVLACKEFENYFRNPEIYGSFFGRPYAGKLIEKWKNPAYQNCILFEGKYSYVLYDFCCKNGIATQCNEGIRMSRDLAFVFMSILANLIATNNELEMITDSTHYSSLILSTDTGNRRRACKDIRIAENNIELAIPIGLQQIPIERIIRLRQQEEFRILRKAYIAEIDKLIEARENNNSQYSLEDLLSYKKDFIKMCEESFVMLAAVYMSIYNFTSLANGIHDASVIPEIATAVIDCKAVKDSITEIPKFVKELRTKQLARRYLARIKKLNLPYPRYGRGKRNL